MERTVVVVVGARPNFMKAAPVLRALEERGDLRTRLVHTGQHYDDGMSAVFLRDLGIREPDADLGVGSGPHGRQTGRILEAFEADLLAAVSRPAGVLVFGDVNSTLACALAAAKLGVPVAHVEAGLRSFDRTMPEEINRVLTDAVSDLLFVTEDVGRANLRAEGIPDERVHLVGNVMIDTLRHLLPRARVLDVAGRLGLARKGYILATLHRPANVDERSRLAQVVEFLRSAAGTAPIVFPVHPRTRNRLEEFSLMTGLGADDRIRLIPPVGYLESLALVDGALAVISDSGGIQSETTFLDVPCLTLRETTEQPVTVERGTNTLVAGDPSGALPLLGEVRAGSYKHALPIDGWDGRAAERIAEVLGGRWA